MPVTTVEKLWPRKQVKGHRRAKSATNGEEEEAADWGGGAVKPHKWVLVPNTQGIKYFKEGKTKCKWGQLPVRLKPLDLARVCKNKKINNRLRQLNYKLLRGAGGTGWGWAKTMLMGMGVGCLRATQRNNYTNHFQGISRRSSHQKELAFFFICGVPPWNFPLCHLPSFRERQRVV